MNGPEIVKRIYRERKFWRNAGDGTEVQWTVKGLDIALDIVHSLAKEEQRRALERRPRLNRWIAGDLFRAITQALAYLNRCDRGHAIRELTKARDAALSTRKIP